MPKLTEIEAAIHVKMSPTLLRWFTANPPKYGSDRKLPFTEADDEFFYDSDELDDFNEFLKARWQAPPKATRPSVPEGIKREIVIEANHKCAFCDYSAHSECAHIDAVSKTACNHPHNLINACPNHHTEYDHGLKISSAITAGQVKVMKDVLQGAQLRRWRIELRASTSLLSLIKELEKIKEYLKDPKLFDIQKTLQQHAKAVLSDFGSEATKPTDKKAKSQSPNYQGYLKKIGQIIPARDISTAQGIDKVVEEVAEATADYLEQDSLVECPLCEGDGVHNRFRCPICRGDGTVSVEMVSQIDLRPYAQEECPLCEGTGEHNRFDCPVCHRVGTVDHSALDQIDLSPYEQTDCPLCEASGTHNGRDCPICAGVGTIDERLSETLDLSGFKQVECPLCEGKGTRKGGQECPICRGEKTVDQRAAENIDLWPYEQVECPLCEGKGDFKSDQCPVCEGDGEIDRGYAENLDLDRFGE